jgi:6-phosphogluconate dehydrogenase (decarboxylating)
MENVNITNDTNSTHVVDPEKNIMAYNVLEDAIINNQPIQSVFEKLRYNDIVIDGGVDYLKHKYGTKANPANPNSIDDNEIDNMYKQFQALKK